ncbi:apolipoprotein D-like [Pectinophora gossypiella]|uniref:apolipoprotein D-like n=1 Tax=Pectinophora gossypiella TaxID=13191 RepID=UPI00214EFC44|nr:apolipoprotein D-like [Pectinophora gossypiella]
MGDFRVRGTTKAYVILFCALVKTVISTGLGKCPIYPQFPNFDVQRMTGTWYEVERSFYLMEISASCTELQVALNDRGYLLITVNTLNRWTGSPSTSYGIGIPSHNGSSSFRYKLNNRMPYIIGRMLPGAGQYNVLFTDYDTFAIVWSCSSVSVAHSDRMWVLGRSREIEARVRAQIYAILEELQLDPDRLIISKNNNCTDQLVANVL